MTRLFHTGFEMGGPTSGDGIIDGSDMFSDILLLETNNYARYSTTTAEPVSNYSLHIQDWRGGIYLGGTDTEFYARLHYRQDQSVVNSSSGPFFGFRVAGLEQCSLRQSPTTGAITANRTGTVLGTGPVLTIGRWYLIECHVIIHASTGVFTVKVNGTTEIDLSGVNTKAQSAAYADGIVIGVPFHFSSIRPDCYFDDIAVNNASGTTNNTWIGEGAVVGMFPNAAGDTTALLRGGADSGSNFGQVDEAPPNDLTDYVYSTAVADRDLYNFPGVPGGYNTTGAVQVWARATLDSAGLGVLALTLKSGGTVNEGTQQTISPMKWRWFWQAYDVDPTDSAIWTLVKVDALQAGVTVR